MSDTSGSRHDPLAALRQRGFIWYSIARFASGAGQTLLQATLLWQVYALSGSAAQLGVLGLVRFVPQLMASLYAGAIADRYDRRRIVMVAQSVPAVCTTGLLAATVTGTISLPIIYALVMLIGLGNAFEAPARQALLPSVVHEDTFQNAVTVSSTIQSLAFITGPGIAGLLIQFGGVPSAYAVNVGLIIIAWLAVFALRPRAVVQPPRAISWEGIKEGVRFVFGRQPLLGSMALDMFAVIFGGAQALLPVYATDILGVGESGYGILSAAMPAGAFLMSFVLLLLPQVERTGRTLLFAVAAFGLATIAFGLSRSFPLSVAAYMAVGMADQVSVVMRQTTIQLATPDYLRGRVTSVGQVFIGSSNQLGAVESGFVAAATSATFAVVSGGAASLAILSVIAAKMPELRSFTITHILDPARRDDATATDSGDAAGG